MKKLGLSLIAAAALVSSATASSNLVEALTTQSKISGEVSFLYTSGSNSNVKLISANDNSNNASAAIDLNYKSGDFNGFKIGVTGQVGWDLRLHDQDAYSDVNVQGEDDYRNTVTAREFSQAYLEYARGKTITTIGRQFIATPLLLDVVSGYEFPMKDSFDAIDIKTKEIKDTFIQLTYVDQVNKRYSNSAFVGAEPYNSLESDVEYQDGLWSLYIRNNSIKSLVLDAQYLDASDHQDEIATNGDAPQLTKGAYKQYLIRGEYTLPTKHMFKLGLTYTAAKFDESQNSKNGKEADIFGVQLTTNAGPVILRASYTKSGDEASYPGSTGDWPNTVSYTDPFVAKTMYAGIEAYSLQADYKFHDGLKTSIKYVIAEQSDEGKEVNAIDKFDEVFLDISYDLSFIAKGLSTRATVAYADYDGDYAREAGNGSTQTYGRYWLNYKF